MKEQTKQCTKCKKVKSLSEFGKNKQAKDGKTYWCLQCKREYNAEFRLTPKGIYQQLKGRTKFYDRHPVTITQEEFVEWYENQPQKCHYCGIPIEHMEYVMKHYGSRWLRLTIDCKDNPTGYAKGNLVLACDKCNSVKSNILSYEDMIYVGENFIKPKWQALIMNKEKPTTKIEGGNN